MDYNNCIYILIPIIILLFVYYFMPNNTENFSGTLPSNSEAIANAATIINTGNFGLTNATITGKLTANDISANSLLITGQTKISGATWVGDDLYIGGDKKAFSKSTNGKQLMVNWADNFSEGVHIQPILQTPKLHINTICDINGNNCINFNDILKIGSKVSLLQPNIDTGKPNKYLGGEGDGYNAPPTILASKNWKGQTSWVLDNPV